MFLFVPDVEGGEYVTDLAHSLSRMSEGFVYRQGGGVENGGGTLTVERHDVGLDSKGNRTFGPESMYLRGKLMPGTYALMTMIFTDNPNSVYTSGCASVSLYSGNSEKGQVLSRIVGDKGKDGNWWHVFNMIVEYDEINRPRDGEDWQTCEDCIFRSALVHTNARAHTHKEECAFRRR